MNKMESIVDRIRSLAATSMVEDDSFEIRSKFVQMNFAKKAGSTLDKFIQIEYGSFSLPSFCEMMASSVNCDSMQLVVQVTLSPI